MDGRTPRLLCHRSTPKNGGGFGTDFGQSKIPVLMCLVDVLPGVRRILVCEGDPRTSKLYRKQWDHERTKRTDRAPSPEPKSQVSHKRKKGKGKPKTQIKAVEVAPTD